MKRHRETGLKIRHSTHLVYILGGLYKVDKQKIMWGVVSVRLPMTYCQLSDFSQKLSETADV